MKNKFEKLYAKNLVVSDKSLLATPDDMIINPDNSGLSHENSLTEKIDSKLKNKSDTELLLADDLIKPEKYLKYLKGINKIELMGGEYSTMKDYLNIDFKAKRGIKGSVFNMSQYIPKTKKLIIMNNLYFDKEFICQFLKQYPLDTKKNSNSLNFFILNLLFKEINQISDKDSDLIIAGTPSNKFFKKINEGNKAFIKELQHWNISSKEKLTRFYQNTEFHRTNGKINKDDCDILIFMETLLTVYQNTEFHRTNGKLINKDDMEIIFLKKDK